MGSMNERLKEENDRQNHRIGVLENSIQKMTDLAASTIGHTHFLLYGEHVKKFFLSILQLSSFRGCENHLLIYLI